MTFEELKGQPMTRPQIDAYLARIGMVYPEKLDLSYLTQLQMAHQSTVPFENLDIMAGIPLSLDHSHLYDKVVTRKRGGVCSELNTLYNWLLESLDFDVVSFNTRVIAKTDLIQSRTHRVMCVILGDKRYLTDVGFNYEHHRIPLLLEADQIQPDGCCDYRLEKDEFWGWLMWQNRPGVGWRRILGFTEERQIDLDFMLPTYYAQYHPNSRINKFTKVSIYDPAFCHAIRSGNYYVEKGGVEQSVTPITSKEQEQELLRTLFRLPV